MFTPHQTGRPASPHPVLQKTVCGRCTVCKVHLNSSADPRLLPCLHIVCNTCLTKICTDGATQDCPLCAQSFCLSEVTECAIFEDTSNNNNIPKCGGCEESEVSGWCVQCEEALCLDCTSAHRRVKVTRDHEVTPKKPPTGWTQRRRCPSHTQESLRFFCLVCEELTCKDCQLITHRGHSFVQQEEAVGLQRQQLQSLLDSIRQQKETVISSLLLLEARLQEIEKIKAAAKKMLTQVVHSIYQALVLKATQMLKVIEALFAEEVGCLLEKKTSLNKLEGCQEYIAAFIDKILCTEGHGLLVHTKRIETQGKKLLSQKAYTPETMIELHLQIQNELCQHIMKFGFLRIRKVLVPFTTQRTDSTQLESVSVKSSNPNSPLTATDVHPAPTSSSVDAQVQGEYVLNGSELHPCASSQIVQMNQAHSACNDVASSQLNPSKRSSSDLQSSSSSPSLQVQSHEVMSEQSKHAYSPSSNPYFPQYSPSVYSQPRLPFMNCTASQINNISESAKCRKTYCPTMQVSQTRILTRPLPVNSQKQPIPVNNQTPVTTHPIPANNQTLVPANNQTPVLTHTMPVDSQTPIPIHPILSNNQAPLLTHQMPVNNQKQPISVNNQTPKTTHPLPANNQTPLLIHQMPINNQTPVPTYPIPASDQTLTPPHPMPANNQMPVLIQPISANNQTPLQTHPIPANNQMPVLIQPISANNQSTILTHSLPICNQTLILTHPIQTNFLGPGHSFSVQPNIPLTVLSTVNALSLNDATAVSNVHFTEASSGRMNHCPQDPCAPDPTSTISNAIPSTASGSLLPVNPVPSAPISGNGTLWSKSSTYNSINVPVKALADSACDQDADVSSTNFTDTDHLESILPTSLVSETAPKEPSPDPAHSSGPSDIHQDSPSTITEKCSRQPLDDQSSTKNYSGPKHWSVGMPTTFRQLVEATCIPVRSKDNLNTTPPADSTPCSTSEDLDGERTTHFKTVQSASDYREAKKEDKKEDKEPAVTVEHFRRQIKQLKRSLRVSLECLPISLPPSGQPLPEFHLTTDASTGHILVQESRGGQVYQVWRWHEDPLPSRSSSCSVSQDSDSSPASDVEFCAVCLSAGAPLLCAKCGCAFHYDCHIPQILTKPCKDWVCLLCQDVNETVVYGSEEMRTPSLSLEDQRKCEKLVFGLLCDENKSLLFSATKNHSKTAEFDIILGRLLGKRKPPYRTVAELVSDVWTLFDILMMNSEKKNMVVKLKQSFQQQLNESFGKSLHPSLLNHSSSKDPSRMPETETEQEKHRNTLKRMREFFTANCGTAAKKSCNDKGKEKDGCGNTAAAEY
ncbi:transcription intermediary factor 1-alpha-like [Cyprinus carpio]|uniref:Transcription intermediary factor 1-alpha-like n=1 Tax=Cyprinus carpio TaxID=7962 RepID=A0A9R0BB02_CYPCA|nr:transcription intermediary factor 1-alpha-like [Cyprinus carpio]